ncbi:multidrug resistance protein NorM [Pseudomonas fluorescens]|uniref:Multidrug resistance protein NorM n=1 Tax=Pseudomonas fluorescens TaxID=294 RepID=A0A379I587_PSEFL|nr:multidrug resistance protein NorM [Pseudomonas fluorescens]
MALALLWYIKYKPRLRRLPAGQGPVATQLHYLRELWRLGLPIGGTYAVEVGLFAFAALCMGHHGQHAVGSPSDCPANRLGGLYGASGMSYAVTMRIGLHYGGGHLLGARLAGRVGIAFGARR